MEVLTWLSALKQQSTEKVKILVVTGTMYIISWTTYHFIYLLHLASLIVFKKINTQSYYEGIFSS